MNCEHPRKDRAVIQNPGLIYDGKTVVCGACKQELYEYNARYYLGKAIKWLIIAGIIVFIAYIIGWTELKQSETQSARQLRNSLGGSL